MSQSYADRVRETRRTFRSAFAVWISVCVVALLLMNSLLGQPRNEHAQPLLSGPPQFILLALIVALAAYLRIVSTDALRLRDQIREGKVWNYPRAEPYYTLFTKQKLDLLDKTWQTLTMASPFIMSLFLIISLRILSDGVARFFEDSVQKSKWFFLIDLVIAVWVLTMFVFLVSTHFKARRQDDEIRMIVREHEDRIHPNSQGTTTRPTEPGAKAQSKSFDPLEGPDRTRELARYTAERITEHESKSVNNLDMFLKLSVAIAGGIGYLAVLKVDDQNLWRIRKIAWSLWYIEAFVAAVFAMSIFFTYCALWRQWVNQHRLGLKGSIPAWYHTFKHVEFYWILSIVVFPFLLKALVLNPLFR